MSAAKKPRIVDVDEESRAGFLAYAAAHGGEQDDSYTTREQLARFDLATEPAVVAVDKSGEVVGAASAMVRGYVTEGLSRFRILHAMDPDLYPQLIDRTVQRLPEDVRRVFIFLGSESGPIVDALASAEFVPGRRAFVLANDDPGSAPQAYVPTETKLEPALASVSEDWANIVNAAFRGYPGRYDMTEQRAREMLSTARLIPEGTLIARKGGAPAGVVMTTVDPTDPHWAEIDTLAVLPAQQGKGIGRALLKAALTAAARYGYNHVSLSVNGFNRRAIAMYLNMGFHAKEEYVCWERQLRPDPVVVEEQVYDEPVVRVWDFTAEVEPEVETAGAELAAAGPEPDAEG